MADTNIQFYTDTRTVFKTSDNTSKVAIGSANGTTQGFEIAYDLLTTQKEFKISKNGVNYTSGITNDTTSLPRLALTGTLLQSLEVPPNPTTLEVNKTLLLTDNISTGSIGIVGTTTQVDASGDLVLNPVGSISANGKTLDMTNGEIHKCPLIHGANNTDMYIEAKGTGDLILETNGINRLTITDTGSMTFEGGMTYNNTTNTLTATNFTGLASNATNSSFSSNISITEDNSGTVCYPTFVKSLGSGQKNLFMDGNTGPFSIIPSTGELKVGTTVKIEGTGGNQKVNIGVSAGGGAGGTNTVAIGTNSGITSQGNGSVAIGNGSGNTQGISCVAIGAGTGTTSQGQNATALGVGAGATSQGTASVAIGQNTADRFQGNGAIAIGLTTGKNNQGAQAIAIGDSTAIGTFNVIPSYQGAKAIAIGVAAAQQAQGVSSIAIGENAALNTQGAGAIAIGQNAGTGLVGVGQGIDAIAIGTGAARGTTGSGQGDNCIAIGNTAGAITQGTNAVAIGNNAGNSGQGTHSVAIGNNAASSGQGSNCVAIGRLAGSGGMVNNSIAINGSGVALPAANAGFYVNPIRGVAGGKGIGIIYYLPITGEVVYSTN